MEDCVLSPALKLAPVTHDGGVRSCDAVVCSLQKIMCVARWRKKTRIGEHGM